MRAVFIVWMGLILLTVVPGQARPPVLPETAERRSPEPRPARFPALRDGATSALPGPAFRQAMMEELRTHVPLFHDRMQALRSLQQERQKIQIQKREAAQTAERSEVKLHRFHELLRREDALTSRQKSLLNETAREAEAIRTQIALRRTEIEVILGELEKAPPGPTVLTPDAVTSDSRFLTRALRVYEFLDQRFAALQKNPRQPDWMRPLLKGMFIAGEEGETSRREKDERRLRHLRSEQEELRRRMQRIQREIDELNAGLKEERKPMPRMRPRPDRQVPGGEPAALDPAADPLP